MENYCLTTDDASRIANVAEKIYQKRLDLGDTIIGWEEFTSKYMKFSLPEFGDELTTKKWVDARSTWTTFLNKEFLYRKYPIQLFVSPCTGVFVRVHGDVIIEKSRREIKKIVSGIRRYADRLDEFEKSLIYPESTRIIKTLNKVLSGTMNELSTGINNTPGLPGSFRKELRRIIEVKLPKKNDDELKMAI
jgi:hypothetical protein